MKKQRLSRIALGPGQTYTPSPFAIAITAFGVAFSLLWVAVAGLPKRYGEALACLLFGKKHRTRSVIKLAVDVLLIWVLSVASLILIIYYWTL